ncbi:ATP-dependent DNA ligase I [Handroanthus impetiginosus]|uniref:DNA ligase n=1 Tax=Handroanthus impetiginosus TaxID=429701 RepID=A0A2G9H7R0_9LAMI|nr:ATP-dependent DNA ligase I [Handroanthus impetiginosus]
MSASKPPQRLNLSSVALHRAAISSLSLPPHPPLTSPVVPPPASIPHSKLIPKTRFIVDGFKHADSNFSVSYFLSHFHSDHYTGLFPQWSKGIIYCSSTTAKLLHQVLKIPEKFVFPLPLSQPLLIEGSEVCLIDANHCPGAVQFLFKVPVNYDSGKSNSSVVRFEKYVHTGDFRYSDEMKNESVISEFIGADAVFLDTTYCNPKFVFPSQEESIDYIVGVIKRMGVENEGGVAKNVLFLVATYVIGKEKILMEIAKRCERKIHVSSRKMEVLCVLGLGENGVFTEDELESDVHVVGWNVLGETWPYFRPNFVKMKEIMSERGYSKVVGFVPTGWTYEVKRNKFAVRTKDSFEIHLVPYSEHSNYDELREYVKFLKPKHVVPTVGADVEKLDSKHASAMQKHFAGLVDEMAIKQEFLMGFHRGRTGAVDVEKDSRSVCDNIPCQEGELLLSTSNCCSDVELEDDMKSSFPQEKPPSCDSEDLEGNDLEKPVQELRDCLPSWVTLCQMLDLLKDSGGNVVEAVSNFYEHETEFHEQVIPCISVSSALQVNPENEPALPFESQSVKGMNSTEEVSLSQSFKLSNPLNVKKSGTSPGKRKKNLDGKATKKARAGSTRNSSDPKQHTITKFFNKKMAVVSEDSKVEAELNNCPDDQNRLPSDAAKLYKEEVNHFIQIVNGDESLRSYAATILEKANGDINMALDMYYNDKTGTTDKINDNMLESNELMESERPSRTCSVDIDAEVSQSNKLETKSDYFCPALPKDSESVNYISLPPERYSPIGHACWRKGQPAPYIHIARTFDLVEEEKGKLKATTMLCNMFRSLLALSPADVLPAVYLCTNKIAPDHENMELNIGGSMVVAALEEACGTNRTKINSLYNSLGDLGDVAQLCRQTQSLLAPPAALTIQGVYSVLRKISVQTGTGSTNRKKSLIVNLMCSCREKEMKFLVRTLVRNLRIGAMMRTVLPALAQAIVMHWADEKVTENLKDHFQRLSSAVVEAYNILLNMDLLVPSLLEKGIEFSSTTLSMVPGTPIKPMLAKITNGAPQVLKIFQDRAFTCEYKYDGQRAQIHRLANGSIHVFSRNGDETTSRFPDLVDIIKDSCCNAVVTFILDAEVVAVDRKNGLKLMSFQELSSRERGSKDSLIDVDKIKIDICIFVFDIMFANGEQLLDQPLRRRRKYLKDLFGKEKPGYFEFAREMTVESQDADANNEETLNRMNSFLDDALRSSCEGIMVKSLDIDAGYTPSKRSDAWLKVKRDYVEGLRDSLDLVPIGAWHGNGRKAGWFSPFLMACYNPDTEEFQSVCRVMSGFSDAFYKEMKDFFSGDRLLSGKPPYYRTGEVPDMWFSPELVWEIRGADFTVSPVHHAAIGLVHPSRGISVRFPRFIRSVLDRKPEECSTAADIADMFSSQTRKMDVNEQ